MKKAGKRLNFIDENLFVRHNRQKKKWKGKKKMEKNFTFQGHVFDDEKCKDCIFLPICFGGCKFHRYHLKKYACAFNEESVISYIEDCIL